MEHFFVHRIAPKLLLQGLEMTDKVLLNQELTRKGLKKKLGTKELGLNVFEDHDHCPKLVPKLDVEVSSIWKSCPDIKKNDLGDSLLTKLGMPLANTVLYIFSIIFFSTFWDF